MRTAKNPALQPPGPPPVCKGLRETPAHRVPKANPVSRDLPVNRERSARRDREEHPDHRVLPVNAANPVRRELRVPKVRRAQQARRDHRAIPDRAAPQDLPATRSTVYLHLFRGRNLSYRRTPDSRLRRIYRIRPEIYLFVTTIP